MTTLQAINTAKLPQNKPKKPGPKITSAISQNP